MKLTLLAISTLFCLSTNAQIKKGATLLGGNIGINHQSIKGAEALSDYGIYLSTSFSKAVKQNLTVGFNLNYSFQKHGYSDSSRYVNNSYGAGLIVRKYKYLGSSFYLFAEADLNGDYKTAYTKNSYYFSFPSYYNSNSKGFDVKLSINPGLAYAITKRWQVETEFTDLLSANFFHEKVTDKDFPNHTTKFNSYYFGASLSGFSNFSLGLRLLINK